MYAARGGAYLSKGEYDMALEDFNRTIQLDSNNCNAYAGRGNIYILKKEYDRGIKDMETALRINPNLIDVRKSIEIAQMMRKTLK